MNAGEADAQGVAVRWVGEVTFQPRPPLRLKQQ